MNTSTAMRVFLALALFAAACTEPTPPEAGVCAEMTDVDAGEVSALRAQRCNVPSSRGASNWYRLSAVLPGTDEIIQVELWPDRGAFRGGLVQPGTYTLGAADLDYATCGVCLRAVADKGLPTEREYFATAGTVEVTAVSSTEGAPFVATIVDASFAEVNDDHVEVAGGCSMDLARAKINGAVQLMGGSGGGSGGGGTGGAGGCETSVGD